MASGVFGVLDVSVTLGFAFESVASKLCFHDSLSSNGDFGGWECAQNVSKSFQTCGVCGANFVEAHMI